MPSRPDIENSVMSRLSEREQNKMVRPRNAAYFIVVLWLGAVVIWGVLEHLIDKDTFPTVWLGMWWALQTVTTVGYGDIVPESTVGRLVATFLLLGGLAFLSVVTATITSSFVARRQAEMADDASDPILSRIERLDARLEGIEAELRRLGGGAGSD